MTRDRKTMLDWTIRNLEALPAKEGAQVLGYALDIFTHPAIYGEGQEPDEARLRRALISCYKAVFSALPVEKIEQVFLLATRLRTQNKA